MYTPYPRAVSLEVHCTCTTKYRRDLTCVDLGGKFLNQYIILFWILICSFTYLISARMFSQSKCVILWV